MMKPLHPLFLVLAAYNRQLQGIHLRIARFEIAEEGDDGRQALSLSTELCRPKWQRTSPIIYLTQHFYWSRQADVEVEGG